MKSSILHIAVTLVLSCLQAWETDGRCYAPNFSCPQFSPCCSKYGYCGSTPAHCAPENCQANCWPSNAGPTLLKSGGQSKAKDKPKAEEPLVVHDPNLTQSIDAIYRKQKYFPEEAFGVYVRCVDPTIVALTFDDGPSQYTPKLLDILDQEGVKATFFVLARNLDASYSRHYAKNQHTLREIVKRGHLFGSHSYNHPNFVNAGNWNVENDMRKADDIFHDILGFKPRLMRPPEGAINQSVAHLLQHMGYYIVNWSHDTNDWKHASRDPIRPLRYVKSRVPVRPSNPLLSESIILLQHDTYEATVESQAAVIRNLKAKGYRFATLDECLNIERPYRK